MTISHISFIIFWLWSEVYWWQFPKYFSTFSPKCKQAQCTEIFLHIFSNVEARTLHSFGDKRMGWGSFCLGEIRSWGYVMSWRNQVWGMLLYTIWLHIISSLSLRTMPMPLAITISNTNWVPHATIFISFVPHVSLWCPSEVPAPEEIDKVTVSQCLVGPFAICMVRKLVPKGATMQQFVSHPFVWVQGKGCTTSIPGKLWAGLGKARH